jgi:hypothetical protein
VVYHQTCRRIVPYPLPPSTDPLPAPCASDTMGAILMGLMDSGRTSGVDKQKERVAAL